MITLLYMIFVHLLLLFKIYAAVLFLSKPKREFYVEQFSAKTSRLIIQQAQKLGYIKFHIDTNNVKLPKQVLIIANHQSMFDIFLCFHLFLGQEIRFVAKQELKNMPAYFESLRYSGHCFVNRKSDIRDNISVMNSFTKRCLKKGWSPCIYPEGTRSTNGSLGEFNAGAYRFIQMKCHLPTLVVAIDGNCWQLKNIFAFFRKNRYICQIKFLTILPPPLGRNSIQQNLKVARKQIQGQLEAWRSDEGSDKVS